MKIDLTHSPYGALLLVGMIGFGFVLYILIRRTEEATDRFTALLSKFPSRGVDANLSFTSLSAPVMIGGIRQVDTSFSLAENPSGVYLRKDVSVYGRRGTIFIPVKRVAERTSRMIRTTCGIRIEF
ncbi:hypothetical protein KBB96_15085 [Luteolibacter ambystomatis]|uniref:Uncharacterized protein n=1 Tax=Luteolibacter ambystomatis TaxID=2824561 RepID=A0A975G6F0_9BACT|nr:hypothetical protein [Luteolibacter ambystomatis]QUE50187.1 hypothetical protein KBB96_15085 [Luteolibacter ambystomatis]